MKNILLIIICFFTQLIFCQEYLFIKTFNNLIIKNINTSKEIISNDTLNVFDFVIAKNKLFVSTQSSYYNRNLGPSKTTYYRGKLGYYDLNNFQADTNINFKSLNLYNIDDMYLSPDSSKLLVKQRNYNGEDLEDLRVTYKYFLVMVKDLSYRELDIKEDKKLCNWFNNEDVLLIDSSGFYVYNLSTKNTVFYKHEINDYWKVDNFKILDSVSFLFNVVHDVYYSSNFNIKLILKDNSGYVLDREKSKIYYTEYEIPKNKNDGYPNNIYFIIEKDLTGNILRKINLNKSFNNELGVPKITLGRIKNDLLIGVQDFMFEKTSGIYSFSLQNNKLNKLSDVLLGDSEIEYLIIR